MKRRWLGILGMMVLGGWGCTETVKYQHAEGKIYGTFYHISYAYSEDLRQQIRQEMEAVNASLSMFNPNSVIAKINRNETRQTDSLFRKMFEMAKRVNQVTEGGYDISVAPLVNAWGFGTEQKSFPDSARIDALLSIVGMDKLEIRGEELIKKVPEMQLDASSIAKGLGVDLVAGYLDARGIADYMVEIGGEVRVKGQSSKGRPWRIGIDRPEDDAAGQNRELQTVVELTGGALATSGNYRNFYVHEGKKYAHTINPRTGYPVQTEILSASVYAPVCMEADAYATGFMVIGLEKAKRVILQDPDLEGCLIYQEEGKLKIWTSDGLKKWIVPGMKDK